MKVIQCLGAGSFGKVFKVQEGQLFLAVKKIPLEFDCEDDSQEMLGLRNQVELLASLTYHPNVVRCYSSYRKDDFFFIVMEFGGDRCLDDLELPLTNSEQITNAVIQLAMGLKHLKNNGVVHRDIKPSNIVISEKGLLKITDFGISKHLGSQNQAKTCIGTPYYTAPEIINEQPYDYSVDIWSFGVVLYELVHGHLPFIGRGMPELRSKIRFETPQIRRDIHPDLQLVLEGCLTKPPKNRMTVEQIFSIPLVERQMAQEIEQSRQYF